MKKVLITGAFGFAGANLTEYMAKEGYEIIAVGRKASNHNDRLEGLQNVIPVFADMNEYKKLPEILKEAGQESIDAVIHLAWGGGRKDMEEQFKNVTASLDLMDAAKALGAKRFVGIGSQAEYGARDVLLMESLLPEPLDAYGACKTAASYLLRDKAVNLGMEFVWGRIFSLIGKYEPRGRMLPDLYNKLKNGEKMQLSSCEQYWDYLDAEDAAAAITALLERGVSGEVYNICHGEYLPLKEFIERILTLLNADEGLVSFGEKAEPFVSLMSSSFKLHRDTGWKPHISFEDSVKKYDII